MIDPNDAGNPESDFGDLYGGDNTFGINDAGQVVGTCRWLTSESSSCGNQFRHFKDEQYERARAFLWLPRAQATTATTLPACPPAASGCNDDVYDLHALAGWSEAEFSFANDINFPSSDGLSGMIWYAVGFKLCDESTPRSIVWRLNAATPTSVPTLDNTPAGAIGAYSYAVSEPVQIDTNTQPYEVAIAMKAMVTCSPAVYAFRQTLSTSGGFVSSALPGSTARSAAVDVEAPIYGVDPIHALVGYTKIPPQDPCGSLGFVPSSCAYNGIDATKWTSSAYAAQPLGNYPATIATDGEARGISVDDYSCGWGNSPTAGPFCSAHAVVWAPGVGEDLTGLPNDPRSSRAEAISLPLSGAPGTDRTVVGWSQSQELGLVWFGQLGAWCEYYADDITLNDVDCVESDGTCGLPKVIAANARVLQILQLHDVNSFGHATGVVRETTFNASLQPIDNRYYAIVLGPAADLDEDLDVDPADLAILLGEWGSALSAANLACGTSSDNGVVDSDDLALLLGSWSGSDLLARVSFCPCVAPGSQEAASSGNEQGQSAWDGLAAISSLGFESPAALQAWLITATPLQIEAIVVYLQQSIGASSNPPAE